QARSRNVCADGVAVYSGARFSDRAGRQVGSEDLHRYLGPDFHHIFQQRDCMRISFFSGGTTRDPDTQGIGGRAAMDDRRIDGLFQYFEYVLVAEEICDIDQDVVVQGLDLRPLPLQSLDVVAQILNPPQCHASHNATPDGRGLVVGKIHFADLLQQPEDLGYLLGAVTFYRFRAIVWWMADVRVFPDTHQLLRDPCWRQHHVDATRGDGAVRHSVVLGRLGILSERDSTFVFYGPYSQGAIRRCPGQNHANGIASRFG